MINYSNLFPKNIALRLLKRIILIYSNFVNYDNYVSPNYKN